MARGKNGRRRASLDGPAPSCLGHHHRPGCPCANPQDPLVHPHAGVPALQNNTKEIEDAIEFHWKNLSTDLKQFLLKCPQELSLRKFVGYWTHPSRVEHTSPNIAASVCGCSWYLALNYLTLGKVVEARALVLNGCFLQQCYNKPIEEIAAAAKSSSGDHFRTQLPFFTDGLLAISTPERLSNFLKNKVSSDYQRRMSFATQTSQSKQKVQRYVDQISSDWGSGASAATTRQKNEARRRASLDSLPADSFVEIKLVDQRRKEETTMRYGLSMPLKTLFKKYAEDRDLSLRQLRFSYEGRTLFLSSVGHKSPKDLGMENLDTILVIDGSAPTPEEECTSSSSDESKENARPKSLGSTKKKGSKQRKRRPCRRASWAGPEVIGEEERHKLKHSQQLTNVFAEATPQFEQMRQRLNALNLTNTPPKVKGKKKLPVAIEPLPFLDNPNSDGIGGKAGVPFYAVHVGAPENLYTTKKHSLHHQKAHSIDLHGMTKEEALSELDAKLPDWMNMAMRGESPWVIRAIIICGGGNQVLSEAVEGWIKRNENVAKAPKRKLSRRRTVG